MYPTPVLLFELYIKLGQNTNKYTHDHKSDWQNVLRPHTLQYSSYYKLDNFEESRDSFFI